MKIVTREYKGQNYDIHVTREYKGQNYDIHVNERGRFTAVVNGFEFNGQTMAEVVALVEKQLKTKSNKLNIRAACFISSYDGGSKVIHGSFTGIHAGTGNYLFKSDNEKGSQQVYKSSARSGYLPEEFADEYQALCTAAIEATKARDAFLIKNHVDFSKLIDEALQTEDI